MPLPITPLALLGIAAISVAIIVLLALHIWYSRLDRRRSRSCSNDIELEKIGGVRGGGGDGGGSAVSVVVDDEDEGRPGQRADGLDAAPPRAVSYGAVGLGDERRDMHDGGWVPRGKRAGVGGGTVRGGGYHHTSGGSIAQRGGDGYFDDWRRNPGGGQRSSSVYSRDTTIPTLMQHDYTYHPVSAAYPGPPAPAPAVFVVGHRSGENDGSYPFPVRYGGGVRYDDDELTTTTTTGALGNMSNYERVRPRTSMDVVRSASAMSVRSASADVVQGQQVKQKQRQRQRQKQQQPLQVHPWRLSYT